MLGLGRWDVDDGLAVFGGNITHHGNIVVRFGCDADGAVVLGILSVTDDIMLKMLPASVLVSISSLGAGVIPGQFSSSLL